MQVVRCDCAHRSSKPLHQRSSSIDVENGILVYQADLMHDRFSDLHNNHYEKHRAIFHGCKNENLKNENFLIFAQNIEYPRYMF